MSQLIIGIKLSINEMMSILEAHFKESLDKKEEWFEEWKRTDNCNKTIMTQRDIEEASIYFFENHAVNYLSHLHNRININSFCTSTNTVVLGLDILSIQKEELNSYDFSKVANLREDFQKIITKLGICKHIELIIL
jgi:hypothetical protein